MRATLLAPAKTGNMAREKMRPATQSWHSTSRAAIVAAYLSLERIMQCRSQCGACCTAPSISSPIPGMPHGKPADTPCVQLDTDLRCKLFGSPLRPAVCAGLQPSREMCGETRRDAMIYLLTLEADTAP